MTDPKPMRGFARLDPQARREIAASGGRAIPADKRSFSTNRQLASEAGRKGGAAERKREAAE